MVDIAGRSAAILIASALALSACTQGRDNVVGAGPAENQGNLSEEAFAPSSGETNTPMGNGEAPSPGDPGAQDMSGNGLHGQNGSMAPETSGNFNSQ